MDMLLLAAAYQEVGDTSSRGGGIVAALFGGAMSLVSLAIALVVLIGMWKLFEKAGKPGWAAVIPLYNLIVLLEIIGKPMWWIVFFLCLGPIGWILASLELAKVFGKDIGFAIGLILLPFVFVPMLGFGDARYQGSAAARV